MSAVEDLILDLPEPDRAITERLRSIILNAVPDMKEKISYGVPYFHRFSNVCYIWPGSIGWMNKTYDGVEFGFIQGHLLSNEQGLLKLGTRKYIANCTFMNAREIDENVIREILYEAMFIDEERMKERKQRKKARK